MADNPGLFYVHKGITIGQGTNSDIETFIIPNPSQTQDTVLTLPSDSMSLIGESPVDGKQYARQDGSWVEVQTVSVSGVNLSTYATVASVNITAGNLVGQVNTEIANRASADNSILATVAAISSSLNALKLSDAPSNGNQYARKDGAWTVVEASSVGGSSSGSAGLTISTLTGTIDGVNASFTIPSTPVGTTLVFINGVLMTPSIDYTVLSSTVTFLSGAIPKPGDELLSAFGTSIAASISGGSGGGTWGTITGTLSAQTDLQTALNAKSDVTTVASISAGLDTRITTATSINSTQQTTLSQLASVSGSFATITTVAAVSAGLNSTKLSDAPSNGSQYARKDGAWVVVQTVSGGGGGGTWGTITGTLSAQTDLQTALSQKLSAASNLSDVQNISAARSNLRMISWADYNVMFEDFLNQGSNIGLGLGSSNASGTSNTIESPVDGSRTGLVIFQSGVGATVGARGGFFTGSTGILQPFMVGGGVEKIFSFGFKPTTVGTSADLGNIWIGLGVSGSSEGSDSIGFRIQPAVSPNLIAYTRAASTETIIDTGIVPNASIFYDVTFWISADGGTVRFYNGNTLLGTITTNIPTRQLGLKIIALKGAATATSIAATLDYVRIAQSILGNRIPSVF